MAKSPNPHDKKRFVCDFGGCDKTFTTSAKLVIHRRVHTGERPFVCDFDGCGKTFSQSVNLVIHRRVHTGERPFVCDFDGCDKTFTQSGSLVVHRRMHTGERPFVCDFDGCDKTFTQSGSLVIHRRAHTGERQFVCDFDGCDKTFSRSGHLVDHRRIHTGERPFVCDFDGCDKTFSQSGGLVIHRRAHTGERPFVCDFDGCGKTFTTSGKLVKHVFYWHTQEGNVRMKKAESRILSLIQKHGFSFKEQHAIDFRCIGTDRGGDRCFIDFFVEIKDASDKTAGFVMLEIDEDQHLHYSVSCEVRRMADVQRTLVLEGNTFPIAFLRYNPDAYRADGKLVRVLKKDRELKLVETLKSWKFDRPFAVYYMYYDMVEKDPALFDDPEYEESFKQYFVGCI